MYVKFLNFDPDSPATGYWDHTWFQHLWGDYIVKAADDSPHQVVVVPGRQNAPYLKKVQEYIDTLLGVVLIVTGDEEGTFAIEKIKHPNMKVWYMTPQVGKDYPNVDRFIGCGITPQFLELPKEDPEKDLDWFFSGQVTHARRDACVEQLINMENGILAGTKGFGQKSDQCNYVEAMLRAKIAPCPGGPQVADSFRVWEALESGCIPIVDARSLTNENLGYWNMIFGETIPFPVIDDWAKLPGLIQYHLDMFDVVSNVVFAGWQMYKRNLKNALIDDYESIRLIHGIDPVSTKMLEVGITAVVCTSPIESNPYTGVIEEAIASIRHHHPDIEIIIQFDGVREEQKDMDYLYQEYIRKVLWKCNTEWENVTPLVFIKHCHQVQMMRETMKFIRTDKILYVEHDAPLVTDEEINWGGICEMIDQGKADLVRFHHEAFIPEPHEHLMLDKKPLGMYGVKAVRTLQWSQRPHVTTKEYYDRILREHFTLDAITFIEDKMHGVVIAAHTREGKQGWNQHKLWIYHPDGGNIKRSYHTDGRGSAKKFDMVF